MAEFVLGTGRQSSVRKIVTILEEQLLRTEGAPRKILARADTADIEAQRTEYTGEFKRYSMKLRLDDKEKEALREKAAQHSAGCALAEENGTITLTCPPPGQEATPEAWADLDEVCHAFHLPEVWRAEGAEYRVDPINIELLFQAMVQYKASDVHLSPGSCPVFRIDGDTRNSELMGALSATQIRDLIRTMAPDMYWEEFQKDLQSSFNFHQAGMGYARASCFIKEGAPHLTLRFLPEKIPSFEDLHVPTKTMEELANLHRGLLLITGMTGSGKSTTVAALIDYINVHRASHILCIENPVEFVHANKKSIVSQRNLGTDVHSFNDAVVGALRHDPDVLLIGEMRDSDTIRSAINAAATGHLVMSTLHANTASEVINRIISFFDPIERDLVKLQLRDCIKCVICQRLVPKKGGGRVPALEVMLNDVKPVGDGIISGDADLIRIGMQQTVSHSFLFEHYLFELYKKGEIELEKAREFSTDISVFDQLKMGTYTVPRLDSIKSHH